LNKGILIIAQNNEKIDYIQQAIFSAKRAGRYMDLPVSLITDNNTASDHYDLSVFDKVICVKPEFYQNLRRYNDGSLSSAIVNFKNLKRNTAYHHSPYKETLLIDSDYLVSNNLLLGCFGSAADVSMYAKSLDLATHRKTNEFNFISDNSVKFYWATVVYFKKSPIAQMFFDLVAHVQDEWAHYCMVYQIKSKMFRNDFAFSIAAHMLNGFVPGNIVTELPGKMYYTTDKDYIISLKDKKMSFLIEKQDRLGEYTAVSTSGLNVHVMNKFNLERFILDKGI
jgi:hypothetical protein